MRWAKQHLVDTVLTDTMLRSGHRSVRPPLDQDIKPHSRRETTVRRTPLALLRVIRQGFKDENGRALSRRLQQAEDAAITATPIGRQAGDRKRALCVWIRGWGWGGGTRQIST